MTSTLRCGRFELALDRPLVMGVVNVTPDSFYDGGRHADAGAAIARARQLAAEGADLLDVGGESSRPGAAPVTAEEELARVLPVLEGAADLGVPVSVDTTKPEVMRAVLARGAAMINDITALATPGALELRRCIGCGGVRDAHAGQPAHDAGGSDLRRRDRRGARLPGGARGRVRRGRRRLRPDRRRSRFRLRQDRRAQPDAARAARRDRGARLPGARRLVAEVEPRPDHRPPGRGKVGRERRCGTDRRAARR